MTPQCRLCGSLVVRRWWHGPGLDTPDPEPFTLFRCTVCGFGFVVPVPATVNARALYPEAFYRRADARQSPRNLFSRALARYEAMTAQERLRWLGPPTGDHRLLDVGCGNGAFLHGAARAGWTGVGVEPSGRSAEVAHAAYGVRVHYDLLERAPLEPQSFEAVTFWHVLEHVADVRGTLRTATALLRRDGTLVVSVPNFAGWECRLYRGHWALFDVPRHVNFFTPANLRTLLRELGLTIEAEWHFSREFNAPIAVQSLLNLICSEPMFLYKLAKREYSWDELNRNGRGRGNLAASVVAGALLGPGAVALSVLASALRKGSVFTARARKTKA
jgi:2-polyprenyl-3-methyl-5-hydroxy-6-metoxy-1,4-benzoquinol methylase